MQPWSTSRVRSAADIHKTKGTLRLYRPECWFVSPPHDHLWSSCFYAWRYEGEVFDGSKWISTSHFLTAAALRHHLGL